MLNVIHNISEASSANVNTHATYITHPCLLICPRIIESKRSFVIELRSTEPAVIVEDPLLTWAVFCLPQRFTEAQAKEIWSQEERAKEAVDDIWEFAISEGLFLSEEAAEQISSRQGLWEQIGWRDAGIYHEGTRDYPFVAMNHKDAFLDDNARMKEYEDGWMAPAVYESFASSNHVDLLKVDGALEEYVCNKNNSDAFKNLSVFFDFCFGERFRLDHAYDEQNFLQLESLRKAIPSGGGRHPTEAFLLCLDDRIALPKGLYHYNVKANRLDLLRTDVSSQDLHSLIGEQTSLAAPAYLFLTSLCERAMWRYRDPRSWRAFVIDVGHIEYMCAQLGSALNYSLEFTHKFDWRSAARFLNLDPFRQPLMSIAALNLKGAADNV